jgi:WD40 repeat protein
LKKGHAWSINSIAISPDGNILATGGGDDNAIKLWDFLTGNYLTILETHDNCIWSLKFSLDGNILASISSGQTLQLWNVFTGECLNTFQSKNERWNGLAFISDSKNLAVGSSDGAIKLLNIETGKFFKTFRANEFLVNTIVISSDDTILVAGGDDHTIRIWNINTGQCIKTLNGHEAWITEVAITSDNKTLASCSSQVSNYIKSGFWVYHPNKKHWFLVKIYCGLFKGAQLPQIRSRYMIIQNQDK